MPHTSAFAQRKPLYRTVPPVVKHLWVDLVTSVFNNFADGCQESDNDAAKAEFLTALIGQSRALERGGGGKIGNQELRSKMRKFESAADTGDFSIFNFEPSQENLVVKGKRVWRRETNEQ